MADEWENDVDWDFINLAQIPSEIVTHMLNAVHTSHYKYGSVKEVSERRLKENRGRCWERWEKEKNSEALVDMMNYDMFLFMFDKSNIHIESTQKLISLYDEDMYRGTDSRESVTLRTVSEWLREDILNGI